MRIAFLADVVNVHDIRFINWLADTHEILLLHSHPLLDGTVLNPAIIAYQYYHHSFPLDFHMVASIFKAGQLKKLLKGYQPNVVIGSYLTQGGFIGALTGFHPLLILGQGCDVLREPFQTQLAYWKAKYAIRSADAIHVNNIHLQQTLEKIVPHVSKRCHIIPHGIDRTRFSPNPEVRLQIRQELGWVDKKVLLRLRSLEPVYGAEYFIKSLPWVIQQEPDTRVLLLGDGSLRESLMDLIQQLKLKDYIHYIPYLPRHEQLPTYYQAADVYVSTALSDGLSISLLEAMACSLPLVVTDLCSYNGWVQDGYNGYRVPSRDSEATAQAILKLLRHPEQAKEMGKRNFERVQAADVHVTMQSFGDMVAGLIGHGFKRGV